MKARQTLGEAGQREAREGIARWAVLLLLSHSGAVKVQVSGPCHVVYVLEKGRRELATSDWHEWSPETS